jgi:hypothetical protein
MQLRAKLEKEIKNTTDLKSLMSLFNEDNLLTEAQITDLKNRYPDQYSEIQKMIPNYKLGVVQKNPNNDPNNITSGSSFFQYLFKSTQEELDLNQDSFVDLKELEKRLNISIQSNYTETETPSISLMKCRNSFEKYYRIPASFFPTLKDEGRPMTAQEFQEKAKKSAH